MLTPCRRTLPTPAGRAFGLITETVGRTRGGSGGGESCSGGVDRRSSSGFRRRQGCTQQLDAFARLNHSWELSHAPASVHGIGLHNPKTQKKCRTPIWPRSSPLFLFLLLPHQRPDEFSCFFASPRCAKSVDEQHCACVIRMKVGQNEICLVVNMHACSLSWRCFGLQHVCRPVTVKVTIEI